MRDELCYAVHIPWNFNFRVSYSEIAAQRVAEAGSRALGSMIGRAKAFVGMNFLTFTKLFESLVIPVLEYGSAVWGITLPSSVNNIWSRVARFVMGVGRFHPKAAIEGDIGWMPMNCRLKKNVRWPWRSRLWSFFPIAHGLIVL